ncbi:MAG: hypothetical protein QM669_05300 [Siphonobacter sp.]
MLKNLYLFCGFLIVHCGYSQQDTTNYPAIASAQQLYQTATKPLAAYYNGREYSIHEFNVTGHQFFESDEWQPGAVFFDGTFFSNVPVLYDAFRDKFLIGYSDGYTRLEIPQEKIKDFYLNKHHFVKLTKGLRPGFYEVLYDGKVKAFCRRMKERREDLSNKQVEIIYTEKEVYFIFKEGQYHFVRSKKSVLNLFPDKKNELKKYLKKFDFKHQRDVAIGKLTEYYDRLQ